MAAAGYHESSRPAPSAVMIHRESCNRIGRYSLWVNEQYRITFRFEGGHADGVGCEDYH